MTGKSYNPTILAMALTHAIAYEQERQEREKMERASKEICRVCDGGPGNNGICLCGSKDYYVPGEEQ